MNLRCFYCQTPFTLGRAEILAALQRMEAENMNHYDAHCPRCRRANSISRQRLEIFYPNWREAAVAETAAPMAEENTPAITVNPPAPAIPVEVAPAANPIAKHPRKRAGSAKKNMTPVPAKAATQAKKPVTTKATSSPKAKPAAKPKATASTKGKPAATSSKKPVAKKNK